MASRLWITSTRTSAVYSSASSWILVVSFTLGWVLAHSLQQRVTHRKAVEEVHQDYHHQEDKDQEEDVAEPGADLERY